MLKLDTDLYTVASGPSASGDLSVPDPSPAEAQELILAHTLVAESGFEVGATIDWHIKNYRYPVGDSLGGFLGATPYLPLMDSILQGLGIPPGSGCELSSTRLAETPAPEEQGPGRYENVPGLGVGYVVRHEGGGIAIFPDRETMKRLIQGEL